MKAKVTAPFFDNEAKTNRAIGDVFEVAEARFKAINSTEYGVLVEKVEAKAAPRKTTRKVKAE